MDRWNRLIVSLVAIFIIVAAVVTLIVAAGAVDAGFLPGGGDYKFDNAAGWFDRELLGLAGFGGSDQVISIVIPIVVIVLMLVVLGLELRGLFLRQEILLPVSSTEDGTLNIESSSVRLLAERTGSVNRNVTALRCRLGVRHGSRAVPGAAAIIIACYPQVTLGTNLQELRDDLQERIKEVVERLTGLSVERVNVVRVRYERGEERRLIGQ
jgi:uncharacterized alkaline shock family protein YloU